jgi:hypothetical protein
MLANEESSSKVTVSKLVASWNASSPISVTELGIIMEVKLDASSNALFTILVRVLGKVMEVKPD